MPYDNRQREWISLSLQGPLLKGPEGLNTLLRLTSRRALPNVCLPPVVYGVRTSILDGDLIYLILASDKGRMLVSLTYIEWVCCAQHGQCISLKSETDESLPTPVMQFFFIPKAYIHQYR